MARIIWSLLMVGGLNSETFLHISRDWKSLSYRELFQIFYGYSETNSTLTNCVKVSIMVQRKLSCIYPG